ncbi:MAG: hypothetical protein ABJO29_16890 [Yoonia sp.]|uniref:hypothetical protein n=1 Tax=Yoonia sp. TaxID=2212373 RepID=UPI00220D68A3|nr:hypothetical protein K3729_01385 [Rhodobacteraceae bacterium S2214]
MASSQQSNRMKEQQTEEGPSQNFDQETRDKSTDALFSLLTHLKRRDEETDY